MSHTLTLSFATLTELSAAVAKLTSTGITVGPIVAQTTEAAAEAAPVKPKAAQKAAAPAASAEPAQSPAPAPAAAAKVSAVDYPTLQKSVFELAGLVQKKGLDSAEHVLSIAVALGSPNFKGLDSSKWAEALEAVKAKIVEVAALEVEVA